jgi:hypothetical protein
LALTIAGGEIYVLDLANYGAVTINKAVSITSEGAVAGVLATGGAGITIAAGAGGVINLRGLGIDGSSGSTAMRPVDGCGKSQDRNRNESLMRHSACCVLRLLR